LKKGPLVVSFYRGVWCPYCNMELQALEAAKPVFDRCSASLLAISPQTASNSRKSVRQNKLTFPILSDVRGKIGAAFGLHLELRQYKSLKADLPTLNDDPSWTLPMPARYVIGQDGTILYSEVNPDYTHRPEPEDMIPVLQPRQNPATNDLYSHLDLGFVLRMMWPCWRYRGTVMASEVRVGAVDRRFVEARPRHAGLEIIADRLPSNAAEISECTDVR
jgi:peroxiredoxin